MKKITVLFALLLVFSLILPVAASAAEPDPVRVLTLNGTTGFGLAGLIVESQAGNTDLDYSFSVETDASNITAALINGDCDIGALPTNAAAALCKKTDGKVQVLALNTRGVLYVVTDGSVEIKSFADLDGQTVFVPAQNPTFLFQALCDANDVKVTIDNSYAQPAELNTAVTAGEIPIAVLPEPLLTVACAKNSDLKVVLDLTKEWDKVYTPDSLIQGCVVVRTEFAQKHPDVVAAFLDDYAASVQLLNDDPKKAAKCIEDAGIFQSAAIAEKAIPRCNICFITGEEMQEQLSAFYDILVNVAPQSIGGTVPGDDFYCILK